MPHLFHQKRRSNKFAHVGLTSGAFLFELAAHLNDRTGNTPYNHDFRKKTKQGEYRWFNLQGQCIRNASGIPE